MFRLKMHIPKAESVDKVLGRIKLPNNKTFLPNSKTAIEHAKAEPFIKKTLPNLNNTPYIQPMRKGTDPIIPRDALHPYEPVKYFGPKPNKNQKELLVAAGSPPPPPPGGSGGDDPNNLNNLLKNLNKNLNKNRAKNSYDIQKFREMNEKFKEVHNKVQVRNKIYDNLNKINK